MSIQQIQEEIEIELSKFGHDAEQITFYLIALGQKNPGLKPTDKTERNLVKGCQTKIWVNVFTQHQLVYLSIDSNTVITKGLGSLLIRLFSGQPVDKILSTDLNAFSQKSFRKFMGGQRSDGFNAMVRHLKMIVKQFSAGI